MHIRRSSVLGLEDEEAERLVRHVSYVLGDARMVGCVEVIGTLEFEFNRYGTLV